MQTSPLRLLFRLLAVATLFGLLSPAFLRAQAKIEGKVLNGTTGKPLANQQVSLLVPRQGMQKVATVATDSAGRFAFDQSDIEPQGFYLLEAVFQGVPYHAPALFKSAPPITVDLTVYEPTNSTSVLHVKSLRIGVRAVGNKAQVQEEFTLQNTSQPPRAFVDPKGTFRFHVPPAVGHPSVAVTGIMDMQLPQDAESGKSPGDYSIHYPLKPGDNVITVAYEADYNGQKLQLDDAVPYAIDRAGLYVMPSTLAVESKTFRAVGVDSKDDIEELEADNLAIDAPLEASLSGEGLPASGAAGAAAQQGGQAGEEPQVKILPTSITKLAWPVLACFLVVLLWALGLRVAKEWSRLGKRAKDTRADPQAKKQISGKADKLLNAIADLDELFAAGKIAEKDYWKERLELKARVVANLKKTSPASAESYASRRAPR